MQPDLSDLTAPYAAAPGAARNAARDHRVMTPDARAAQVH